MFDFKNLSNDIQSNNPCSVALEATYVESDTDSRKEKVIEEFLSSAIDSIAANIWECDFLVRFLDVAQDKSIMSKIRIDVMSKKVKSCDIHNSNWSILNNISFFPKKIKELEWKADNFQQEIENVNLKVSHLMKLFQSSSKIEIDKSPSTTSTTIAAADEQKMPQEDIVQNNCEVNRSRGGE